MSHVFVYLKKNIMKKHLFFFSIIVALGIYVSKAQKVLPYFPLKENFGGSPVSNLTDFLPSINALEVDGTAGTSISSGYFDAENDWVKDGDVNISNGSFIVMPETSAALVDSESALKAHVVTVNVPPLGVTLKEGVSAGESWVKEGGNFIIDFSVNQDYEKHRLVVMVDGIEVFPENIGDGYRVTIPSVSKDCDVTITFALSLTGVPYFEPKGDFGGEKIVNTENFIPLANTFTLELKAEAGHPVHIAYLGLFYTPEQTGDVRFVQEAGIVYVYEGTQYKTAFFTNPKYTADSKNQLQNPSFEDVADQLESGKWRAQIWDALTGEKQPAWSSGASTSVRESTDYCSEGDKTLVMHSNARFLTQRLSDVLKSGARYKLTYDYWTSSGSGNGDATYKLYLGKASCGSDLLKTFAHTTTASGTERHNFEMTFVTPQKSAEEMWFTLHRDISKVDWLDNLKLVELKSYASGITGANNIIYLADKTYAPENVDLGDNYYDMTSSIKNPSFEINGLEHWINNGMQSQTNNTPAEQAGWNKDGNVYVEKWVDKSTNLPDASLSQIVSDLPIGKYRVVARGHNIKQSSDEIVKGGYLFAGIEQTPVNTGKDYFVETVVIDGTLDIGFCIVDATGNWAAFDHFRLHFYGEDIKAFYNHLNKKTELAEEALNMLGQPNCFNKKQLKDVINAAKAVDKEAKDDILAAIKAIDEAIKESTDIIAKYARLKAAIDEFDHKLQQAADYPQAGISKFQAILAMAKNLYDSTEDQRAKVAEAIEQLSNNGIILVRHAILNNEVVRAEKICSETNYVGKNLFQTAISSAKNVLTDSEHTVQGLVDELNNLQDALTEYLKERPSDWSTIRNGALWKDDRGYSVQAHASGFLQVGDTWYMIGEDRKTDTWRPDINMYSSKDLVNWKFERKIIERRITHPDLGGTRMIERAKLMYNRKTGKYVVWCHWESGNYGAQEAAVFYCDSVNGDYKFHWAGRPLGIESRDCNVFVDNDGTAYFISTTRNNNDIGLFRLSDDYLSVEEHTVLFRGQGREAPAVVRVGDTYFMISSACTGWDPNQAKISYSKSLTSGWSSQQNIGGSISYDTQAASILSIQGREGTSYIYVGDRWQDPALAESKTIMFPISFNGNTCTFEYKQQFDLDQATGKWRETDTQNSRIPKANWKILNYSSEETTKENGAAINLIDGNYKTKWHTKYNGGNAPAPHHITVDMGAEYEISGFLAMPRTDNSNSGTIRKYMFYVSQDGEDWKAASGGTWLLYGTEIYFEPVKARYYKMVALEGDFACIAEMEILKNTLEYTLSDVDMRYKINTSSKWELSSSVTINLEDTLTMSPTSQDGGTWVVATPNDGLKTVRELVIKEITAEQLGEYTYYYLNQYGQSNIYTYHVSTKKVIPVTSIILDKTDLKLETGKSWKLLATFLPENTDYQKISWVSSKPEIASVDESGVITAIKPGTAVITAKSVEWKLEASCTVTVEQDQAPGPEPDPLKNSRVEIVGNAIYVSFPKVKGTISYVISLYKKENSELILAESFYLDENGRENRNGKSGLNSNLSLRSTNALNVNSGILSFQIQNIEPNTKYMIRVEALGKNGESIASHDMELKKTPVSTISINQGNIYVFYNENTLHLYNLNGYTCHLHSMDGVIRKVIEVKETEERYKLSLSLGVYILTGTDKNNKVSLKFIVR